MNDVILVTPPFEPVMQSIKLTCEKVSMATFPTERNLTERHAAGDQPAASAPTVIDYHPHDSTSPQAGP
jgi:hypothetical protein